MLCFDHASSSCHLIFVCCAIIGLSVVSFTPDFSQFMARYFHPEKQSELGAEVAKYTLSEGDRVWRRFHGRPRNTRLLKSGSIHHQDQLLVDKKSSLSLNFPNGTELRLLENTKAIIELWNPNDTNSPIYLTILFGDFELLRDGTKGKLFIVKDRQLFSPSFRPKKKEFELIFKSSEIGIARRELNLIRRNRRLKIQMTALKVKKRHLSQLHLIQQKKPSPSSTVTNSIPDTLTNSYIEDTIVNQKSQFQKCQANSIRETGPVNGQVVISFTIDPRGKIDEVKVLQTTIENQQLLNCLLSVFRNTPFQAFKGQPITRSFPLTFE
ncbi:MAG: AgmX/PglI C-terminal domain-containing protein [Bdellovibrionales bacterium]|nr:AgmX/PglI C-terminal domain-containing protein [Bdellovibrionales bacterium]